MSVPPGPAPGPGADPNSVPAGEAHADQGDTTRRPDRVYPPPGQPIPPPAPGPNSTLAAIFARSTLFPLMAMTVWWGLVLLIGGGLGSRILPRLAGEAQCGPACWPTPTLAIVGCALGLLIWVAGLIVCWRRTVLWVWVGAGAMVVVGTSVANLLMLVS